ncbi:MAG: flippase-like domain-containing protein, partial [Cyclobacteriaceae bacterium]|nr:flippase-like domain-containing protein [Cyclobacteriaceae bacterium]
GELINHLFSVPLLYVIPWIMTYCLIIFFSWSVGIYVLLRRIQPDCFRSIINATFKLQVVSTVVPGRLGDLGLLYFLKDSFTPGQTSAVLIIDKVITLGVNAVLTIIGLGILFSWTYSLIWALAIVLVSIFLFWFLFKCPQRFFRWGGIQKIIDRLQGFRVEMKLMITDLRGITFNLLLTVFRFLLAGVSLYVLLIWVEVNVPLFKIILIQAINQFISFIPITTMGLGVQEAVLIYLFNQLSVTPEIILAVSLWARAIHILIVMMVYGFWFSKKSRENNENSFN